MKKLYLKIIIVFFSFNCYSQNLQNANWIFGSGGVRLNFQNPTPTIMTGPTNFNYFCGSTTLVEGCATISDNNGDLMFYTNGVKVFNSSYNIMSSPNDLFGDKSSSQNVVILPWPSNNNKFFIVTVKGYTACDGNNHGAYWSVVDMNLGQVTTVNQSLNSAYIHDTEKITTTSHGNGVDYWILIQVNNEMFSYLVDQNGISNSPVVSQLPIINSNSTFDPRGKIKVSPNGSKVAYTNYTGEYIGNQSLKGLFVGDFNNFTGQCLNVMQLTNPINDNNFYYGLEFSPNNDMIYYSTSDYNNTTTKSVYRINLSNMTLPALVTNNLPYSGTRYTDLQLAMDNRIYVNSNENRKISVINLPDDLSNPDFSLLSIDFVSRSPGLGFPQLIPELASNSQNCQSLTLSTETNTGIYTYQNYSDITTEVNYDINLSTQDITMKANDFVLLKPNTHIVTGSKFLAKIEACTTSRNSKEFGKQDEKFENNQVDINNAKVKIYPNPSNSFVTFESENYSISSITITSTEGFRVFNNKIQHLNSYQLDISFLRNGIYIVTIETKEGKTFVEKLIKK